MKKAAGGRSERLGDKQASARSDSKLFQKPGQVVGDVLQVGFHPILSLGLADSTNATDTTSTCTWHVDSKSTPVRILFLRACSKWLPAVLVASDLGTQARVGNSLLRASAARYSHCKAARRSGIHAPD